MDSPRTPRGLSSPEAKIGLRVEDLWYVQEPMLSPSEKLNSCFESIPVSSFPSAPPSLEIEIPSDASLSDAVDTLSKNKILSAPVRNVDAPEDASWIDRYIGVLEFAGIAVWLLHQTDVAASHGNDFGANSSTEGSFFEYLTSSHFYRNTKVRDISGSFRWAPFLALQKEDSFLTMLLLLSKYRMKSLPVVDLGEGKIENIITQSAVVHMLAECVDLHWFKNWGNKKLFELGLPIIKPEKVVKRPWRITLWWMEDILIKRKSFSTPSISEEINVAANNLKLETLPSATIALQASKRNHNAYTRGRGSGSRGREDRNNNRSIVIYLIYNKVGHSATTQ